MRVSATTPSPLAASPWGVAIALVLLALGGGCEDEPKRTWKPTDHVHPPDNQVDPDRVPSGTSAGGGDSQDGDRASRAAAALWRVTCASCHGSGGRGDGPQRPPGAEMADMTNAQWQDATSDEEIAQVIRQGRGVMPAFGERLNPRGIAALVQHVRKLGGRESTGGGAPGDAADADGGAPDGAGGDARGAGQGRGDGGAAR